MAATWPPVLQEWLNEGDFGLKFGSTVITSEMDIGLKKKRRRFTEGIDVITCSIDIHKDLYVTFESFYKTTLNGSVGTFNFDHPISGIPSEFRFADDPDFKPKGGEYFSVKMNWEQVA